ncbi:hypothetical protein LX36DRAFT_654009 [Colletotrichum falcatum]|nr:hypothetical protein LX36DRAFT_654009 [Colletotrichum falcatum]
MFLFGTPAILPLSLSPRAVPQRPWERQPAWGRDKRCPTALQTTPRHPVWPGQRNGRKVGCYSRCKPGVLASKLRRSYSRRRYGYSGPSPPFSLRETGKP